jgi:hypothetical protein
MAEIKEETNPLIDLKFKEIDSMYKQSRKNSKTRFDLLAQHSQEEHLCSICFYSLRSA